MNHAHLVLIHHAASCKHRHGFKFSWLLVAKHPGELSLELLRKGNAKLEPETIVHGAHGHHLEWTSQSHELWGLAILLTSRFSNNLLHLLRVKLATLIMHNLLKHRSFLLRRHALGSLSTSLRKVEWRSQEACK